LIGGRLEKCLRSEKIDYLHFQTVSEDPAIKLINVSLSFSAKTKLLCKHFQAIQYNTTVYASHSVDHGLIKTTKMSVLSNTCVYFKYSNDGNNKVIKRVKMKHPMPRNWMIISIIIKLVYDKNYGKCNLVNVGQWSKAREECEWFVF